MKDFGPTNKKSRLLPPFATIVCFFLAFPVWTETIQAGGIEFLYYHPAGSTDDLHGRVWDVVPNDYKVAVYIRVNGGWWTKPLWSNPLTSIGSDYRWTCDITTAPTDYLATNFIAFLVPNGYTPPQGSGQSTLPSELYSYPYEHSTDLKSNSAWIEYTYVPPKDSYADLEGMVSGVNPANYRVATYILVNSWWTKPTASEPNRPIDPDGNWMCDITTGGADNTAIKISSFLIPDGYTPPLALDAPFLESELYTYPYVETSRDLIGNTISFAGYNWLVKEYGWKVGPGLNYFSGDSNDVFVDANGHLHLNIVNKSGDWYCSEVILDASPGYGTYVFTTETNLELLDDNIIVGMFLWDTSAPQYNYREFDFEFSDWGDAPGDNSQFVVQPWDTSGNLHTFDIEYPAGTEPTTHVVTWEPNQIYFKSYYGEFALAPHPEDVIDSWYYTGGDLPPAGAETVRINFYLKDGLDPINGQDAEIIITEFQYLTSVSDRVGDVDNDDDVDIHDLSEIAFEWLSDDCDAFNNWCSLTDLTSEGSVDMYDFATFGQYWMDGTRP
jgi:hypothetical protein